MRSGISPRVWTALGAQALVIGALLTVALDQYAHKRVEMLGGVNARGYRGRVLHARKPGEIRVAYAGGSQAFGWGVAADESTAAYLRHLIENALAARNYEGPITAANVAVLGLGARGYATRVARYQYLHPDVVCLHVDLTDPVGGPAMPPASAIAALTGYVPMLPIVLEEKGLPGFGRIGSWLRLADRRAFQAVVGSEPSPSAERTPAIDQALDAALAIAGRAVAVLPMPLSATEAAEHARLVGAISGRVAGDPRLRLVDLSRVASLAQPGLRIDGVNLGAAGHTAEAQAILPAVLDLLTTAIR